MLSTDDSTGKPKITNLGSTQDICFNYPRVAYSELCRRVFPICIDKDSIRCLLAHRGQTVCQHIPKLWVAFRFFRVSMREKRLFLGK